MAQQNSYFFVRKGVETLYVTVLLVQFVRVLACLRMQADRQIILGIISDFVCSKASVRH